MKVYDIILSRKEKNESFESEVSTLKIIERPLYLDRLKRLYGTPDIKIITGLRRSGKSELLRSFVNYLKESYTDINIIRIDFGDLKFDSLKNYKSLYDYVKKCMMILLRMF